jgi:two-component system LytT family sensor kinase
LNKKQIYWLLQVGGWTLYAVVNLIIAYFRDELAIYTPYVLIITSWYFLTTHLFRLYILRSNWLTTKIKKTFYKVLAGILGLALINYLVNIITWAFIGALDFQYDFDPATIGANISASFIIYFTWTLLYFIFHYLERYTATLKYEALKNEIELNNLKSQLNPHFIFNALNSIRALVDENPDKSKDAITQLSGILRSSLIGNKSKLVSFDQEMRSVHHYLNLETVRFEERLKTRFDIDPRSSTFAVPPMMLQTLVENGIKHGISKLKEGGEISIETKVDGELLKIKIRNHGQYVEQKLNGSKGLGIENTIQRLRLLYGEKAHFSLKNEDNATVIAEVILPQNT